MPAKYQTTCDNFLREVSEMGGVVDIRGEVVEVCVFNVGDNVFDDVLWKAQMCCYSLGAGHSWGTDGIGYDANKRRHMVSVMKCVNKTTAKYLARKVGINA